MGRTWGCQGPQSPEVGSNWDRAAEAAGREAVRQWSQETAHLSPLHPLSLMASQAKANWTEAQSKGVKTREGARDQGWERQQLSCFPSLTRHHPSGPDLGTSARISPVLQALVGELSGTGTTPLTSSRGSGKAPAGGLWLLRCVFKDE